MPADMYPAPTPRKKPTMRNPYETPRQRPERIDRKWEQDRDPIFYQAFGTRTVRHAR